MSIVLALRHIVTIDKSFKYDLARIMRTQSPQEKKYNDRDNARLRWHCDSIRLNRMICDRSYVGIDIVRLDVLLTHTYLSRV